MTPGLLVGVKLASIQPADQTPPIQSDKYQCRIYTVISPDDGHMDGVWAAGRIEISFNPSSRADATHQYKFRIDTVISLYDGNMVARNM